MAPVLAGQKDLILFDGICNFCNSYINYVITHDQSDRFVFASLQSQIAAELAGKYNLDLQNQNSIIVIHNQQILTRSDGIIYIARHLNTWWSWTAHGLTIVPQFIRNAVYTWFANRRYAWFGRLESCMIPTPEIREKFLS